MAAVPGGHSTVHTGLPRVPSPTQVRHALQPATARPDDPGRAAQAISASG